MADISFENKRLDNYSFDGYESSKRATEIPKKNRMRTVFFSILIFILSLFLIVEAVYYIFILPASSIANIYFTGNKELSSVNLKMISGITGNETWTNINIHDLVNKLALCPLIESVNASKKFPDKVIVNIVERVPVAVSFTEMNGVTVPIEIDKTGVVFKIGGLISEGLPVISGLVFENPREGMKVNNRLVPFFRQLANLKENSSSLLDEVSEIKIVVKKFGGYELVIYPVRTAVKVRVSNVIDEEILKYMLLILDVINGTGAVNQIQEIDIRSGNAVYVKQGAGNE